MFIGIVIFLGQFCPRGKGAMRLTLCEAPTNKTRQDHNTANYGAFLKLVNGRRTDDRWTEQLTVWLTVCLPDWLTDWLTEWMNEWLRLTDWLPDCLTDWLANWLTDWLRLTDWLTDAVQMSCSNHAEPRNSRVSSKKARRRHDAWIRLLNKFGKALPCY